MHVPPVVYGRSFGAERPAAPHALRNPSSTPVWAVLACVLRGLKICISTRIRYKYKFHFSKTLDCEILAHFGYASVLACSRVSCPGLRFSGVLV